MPPRRRHGGGHTAQRTRSFAPGSRPCQALHALRDASSPSHGVALRGRLKARCGLQRVQLVRSPSVSNLWWGAGSRIRTFHLQSNGSSRLLAIINCRQFIAVYLYSTCCLDAGDRSSDLSWQNTNTAWMQRGEFDASFCMRGVRTARQISRMGGSVIRRLDAGIMTSNCPRDR